MRSIFKTKQFKKDQKRELKGLHKDCFQAILIDLISLLANDSALPSHYNDHALSGNLKDCRDAHLLPDLILIYRKIGDHRLELIRVGSHSELRI
ncbi:MAG: type II toxin-antitoxin system YafQ family toxin [Cyanobacteria bacterium TGS_CYA1]|nr:type II toxin-antitoxin system YafQ family toxin [Cyanobacteria bacterium TGS_CYA1]